ncbi:serine/threonine-protein kinase haspin homolog isoform X1 [Amborella trichopoda]|uniref:serine/threonine-protein kinase haspin homolog isoform X1 n=1 Tax=Amborella trichopoda TaxID=13333 RepID=UPI0009BE36A7|nr:serine/threonine-protein kinase haspin homolog isoform X1 [Amborella trichopoda]|eukprot:XP_020520416.1 serine/threonine-protein kinase haspin homolog isoform X1 [Amborella trichopoda]
MASTSGGDIWSEVMVTEEREAKEINVVYRRRKPANISQCPRANALISQINEKNPVKRMDSWRNSWINRSLCARGRKSMVVSGVANVGVQPIREEGKKKSRPAVRNLLQNKMVQPSPDYVKKWVSYFEEVDAFTLDEESASPKVRGRWQRNSELPQFGLKGNGETSMLSIVEGLRLSWIARAIDEIQLHDNEAESPKPDSCYKQSEMPDEELALVPVEPTKASEINSFTNLLKLCGQSSPQSLSEVISKYSLNKNDVIKIGEGTYGEAFKCGGSVLKIVPFGGDLQVNGEVQKGSAELFAEAFLSLIINSLRGGDTSCRNFIETKEIRVCQGAYNATLIGAWEDWDMNHVSENDPPTAFPGKQCYVVFVLAHGGQDLESFVLRSFEEVQSLLIQVTASLAIAEVACEFEHRDLHWGNVLLSRDETSTLEFSLQGRKMWAKTFGLSVSIIDFTLSRINAGDTIQFLDLSADPELFNGPKRDKQSETYRKMLEVTEGCWEGSFPKTNVLWLHYLVDILLTKKSYKHTDKDLRDLRSLRKRLLSYDSAKAAVSDCFFNELWVDLIEGVVNN